MGIENYPKPLIKELGSDDVPSILLDPSRTFADFGKINFTSLQETVNQAINYFEKFGTLGEYTHLNMKD